MKLLLVVLLCFTGLSLMGQNLDKEDPTYVNIDNDRIEDYINWGNELTKRSVVFDTLSPALDSVTVFPVKVQSDQYNLKAYGEVSLFIVDTSSNKCYGNPNVFIKLSKVSGVFGADEQELVAILNEKYWPKNQKQCKELAYILMQFGAIELYAHLYAEVITKKAKKEEDGWHINYKCQWHYCTNDCFDPIYSFEVIFSEKDQKVFFKVK